MPTDIATTAAEDFQLVINAPAGGDPRTAASVRTMGQALADQSLWNWRRLQTLLGSFAPVGGYAPLPISGVNIATDQLTLTGHGLANNDPVRLVPATDGGVPPTGLAANTVYYTIFVDANTIQVSATSGPGAAVDITGALAGDVYLARVDDPAILLPTVGAVTAGRLSTVLGRAGQLTGANAWTGANTFTDITATGGNSYKVSSRSEVRLIDDAPVYLSAAGFTADNHGVFTDALTGGVILWPLLVPHGQTLTSVSVSILPSAGHGALPATMPLMQVLKRDLVTATTSLIASKTDASANVAAYELTHSLTPVAFAEVIDRAANAYYVRFTGESGVNSVSSLKVLGVSFTDTRTKVGED